MTEPEWDRRAWAQYLHLLQDWGVQQVPRAERFPAGDAQPRAAAGNASSPPSAEGSDVGKSSQTRQEQQQAASTSPRRPAAQLSLLGEQGSSSGAGDPWAEPPLPPDKRRQALEELAGEIARCTRCPDPVATRTQTVPGVGNPNARLCFLGEAPGADEDRLGEPFVGRAGQLLNRIIQACGMKREEVYIFNVLKCRPPGNRTPTETEAANCWPFLMRQIQIIRPEFICCLGAVAARTLLKTKAPMGRLRGKVHLFQGIKVVVTYHPAYLLRNPSAKRQTWEDMKLLLREMGLPIPERTQG